jgi:O-antigen ligase
LIEEAFGGGMSGHWLEGFGYIGVGETEFVNPQFEWEHEDMVNLYIAELARTGLLGAIPFMLVNFYPYRRLYQAGIKSRRTADLWLVHCFAAAMLGWHNAMMTVGSVGQTRVLLFLLFAAANNMPRILDAATATAPRNALASQSRRFRFRRRRTLRTPPIPRRETQPDG